jgi:hypothetical protein
MRSRVRDTLLCCCVAALLLGAQAIAQEAAQQPAQEVASDAASQNLASPDATSPNAAAPNAPMPDAPDAPVPPSSPAVVMTSPRIVAVDVDWNAARAALASFDQQQPAAGEAADSAPADALIRLNDATASIFPKAAASGVPVLLPFDTAAFLRDRAQSTAGDDNAHVSGFRAPTFFYPGPSGYDAAFLLPPEDQGDLHLTFAKPVNVQMTGSAVIYELDGPAAEQGSPVPDLERDFPGIRRMLLENRLRYIFTRFGVPYFVSIACFDGAGSTRRLSCREADHVAVRFLKTLNLVGGAPQTETAKTALATIEQPEQTSPDFTYYAPGDILPGTGMHGHNGKPDTIVYSKIRFPMAHAPAYTNSQSFGSWGNCDLTGRVSLGGRGREAAYRCRVNAVPLFNDETKNYTYPWRDNFCEHRHWSVSQCPAGLGHQGEDIRPSSCKLRNEGADRCEPYQDQVVAVRDGVAWRETGDEALYLTTDAPGEHIRFRYLHMNPHMLDFAGMVSGHEVAEGEVLGPVGDYGKREGGTTYHLHFDMQVLTRQGWVFVNPYMTLVAAYERLIGGRGQVVAAPASLSSNPPGASNPPPADGMVAPTMGAERIGVDADKSEIARERRQPERRAVAAHCQTYVVKGHRRSICRPYVAQLSVAQVRGRGKFAHAVRSVDRRVSRQSAGARYHAGNLHARHERRAARPGRA